MPTYSKDEPSQEKSARTKGLQDTCSTPESPGRTSEYRQTLLLLAKMMATVFICEAIVMVLLAVMPLSRRWSIIVDPVLLTFLAVPVLHWMLFRPIHRALEQRKKAEQKLLIYQKQLKSLASQLSLTEERERRRMAKTLHDQIGQSLILCKVKLDHLRMHGPSGELEESVQEICDDLRKIIQHARNLISDLSSPILHELGLEAALEAWLDEEIHQKCGIKTEFEDDGLEKLLDHDIQTVLFRNTRELLINVVQHASASNVKVSTHRVGKDIHICVEDDGIGFDPAEAQALAAKRGEFGLLGIRERLELAGGSIGIDSKIGSGTKILMTAPLRQPKTDDVPQTA